MFLFLDIFITLCCLDGTAVHFAVQFVNLESETWVLSLILVPSMVFFVVYCYSRHSRICDFGKLARRIGEDSVKIGIICVRVDI